LPENKNSEKRTAKKRASNVRASSRAFRINR
jgi:hypothetical protein